MSLAILRLSRSPRIPAVGIRLLANSRARATFIALARVDKRLHANTWLQHRRYDQKARIHLRADSVDMRIVRRYRATQREIHERAGVPRTGHTGIATHHFHSPFALLQCPLPKCVVHAWIESVLSTLDAWPNYPLARRLALTVNKYLDQLIILGCWGDTAQCVRTCDNIQDDNGCFSAMMRKTGNLADAIGYGDDSAGAFLHPWWHACCLRVDDRRCLSRTGFVSACQEVLSIRCMNLIFHRCSFSFATLRHKKIAQP